MRTVDGTDAPQGGVGVLVAVVLQRGLAVAWAAPVRIGKGAEARRIERQRKSGGPMRRSQMTRGPSDNQHPGRGIHPTVDTANTLDC